MADYPRDKQLDPVAKIRNPKDDTIYYSPGLNKFDFKIVFLTH